MRKSFSIGDPVSGCIVENIMGKVHELKECVRGYDTLSIRPRKQLIGKEEGEQEGRGVGGQLLCDTGLGRSDMTGDRYDSPQCASSSLTSIPAHSCVEREITAADGVRQLASLFSQSAQCPSASLGTRSLSTEY
ncbi:hypothetical protein ElyMa_006298500 [Elysia marginata]|uniref:Uncharacterized protein n=1 Tax=Elysia marginata TaxID=1093978 RepID=A0AAV4HFP3_9GAST|nr:hypothetical protein ElyMa_006298500 [Elysia marginata]